MTTTQHAIVPRPLDPRDTNAPTHHLWPGGRVRITTTKRPRRILTVSETHSSTIYASQLVLMAPPVTTVQHATYHCAALQSDSLTTVVEYTHASSDTGARCIGSLITIVYLPQLSTSADDTAPRTEMCTIE